MAKNGLLAMPSKSRADSAPPAGRASWVGKLQIGLILVPVKAFATIASQESPLCLVHSDCGQSLQRPATCPRHGAIPSDDIAKGFRCADGTCLEISAEELTALSPKDTKVLNLERFFDPDQLDLALLSGRSLSVVCEDAISKQFFAAVVRAMASKKKWAIGRIVLSGAQQPAVVYPCGNLLLLHTLYSPHRRRARVAIENGAAPKRADVLEIARHIDSATGEVAWHDYDDEGPAKLAALIQRKLAGRKPKAGRSRNGRSRKASKANVSVPISRKAA